MFFKVLKSFFSFLSWYGLFLIAFGLSFFILLHQDVEHEGAGAEEEYPYFNSTFLSVVKTMTMFVGELEFSDIPISLESSFMPLNYLFFLTFVFLIVVVLMNLLNGLAVSDTGAIQEQAEIYSHLSRVETISYLESVLLGDPFDFLSNVPRFLSFLPACSLLRQAYRSRHLSHLLLHLGAGNILLFYSFLREKRSPKLFPNRPHTQCALGWAAMDPETIQAAKRIVNKRGKGDKDGVEGRLAALECKLDGVQAALQDLTKMLSKSKLMK